MFVRGEDGKVRALSSICRHRAVPVTEDGERGNVKRFQCPYHLWTYGLDGKLTGAPFMTDNRGFDKTRIALPEFRVGGLERHRLRELRRRRGAACAAARRPRPLLPVLRPGRSRLQQCLCRRVEHELETGDGERRRVPRPGGAPGGDAGVRPDLHDAAHDVRRLLGEAGARARSRVLQEEVRLRARQGRNRDGRAGAARVRNDHCVPGQLPDADTRHAQHPGELAHLGGQDPGRHVQRGAPRVRRREVHAAGVRGPRGDRTGSMSRTRWCSIGASRGRSGRVAPRPA